MKIRELIRKKLKEVSGIDKMLILFLNERAALDSDLKRLTDVNEVYFSVFGENIDKTIAFVEVSKDRNGLLKYNKPIYSLSIEQPSVKYVESFRS